MTHYSIVPRDCIFVKNYGLLSYAKCMNKNIRPNISKSLGGKYSQNILDYAKQSATDALKTASKRAMQKTTRATVDLSSNKMPIKKQKS